MELKKKLRDKHHQLLLMLARKGNEDAFRRLYREIHDPVAAYVNRRVMNANDAEDIIADVFHKFLLRLDSFDSGKGSVLTWIVTMARHAVIDHHRRVRPVTVNSDDLDSEALVNLVRDDFPALADAEIVVDDLQGTITESWAERFGREVFHIDTDGATDEEIRAQVLQQLAEQGFEGEAEVNVTTEGDEQRIEIKLTEEEEVVE